MLALDPAPPFEFRRGREDGRMSAPLTVQRGTDFQQILTVLGSDGKRLSDCGGMAEWFKAAVLKTVVRKYRGFESYFLRHPLER